MWRMKGRLFQMRRASKSWSSVLQSFELGVLLEGWMSWITFAAWCEVNIKFVEWLLCETVDAMFCL